MEYKLKSEKTFKNESNEYLTMYHGKETMYNVIFTMDEKWGVDVVLILNPIFCPNEEEKKEIFELICRSVCKKVTDTRQNLVRRTNNKQLIVDFYSDNEDLKNFIESNKEVFESIGYEKIMCYLDITSKIQKDYYLSEDFTTEVYDLERDEYLSWDEYFLASAVLASMRSKDPSTQVGACIVGENKIKLSEGYNGAPIGWKDSEFPWARSGEYHDTKYPLVIHAEANAITHCIGQGKDLHGATIYVDLFPCNQCAQLIVQSGIKEVVYLKDKYAETDAVKASKRLFDMCGVTYRQINPEKEITLKLKL